MSSAEVRFFYLISSNSLGGSERWVAPGGTGSSPVYSIMHTKKYLKKKLRKLDRKLSSFSFLKNCGYAEPSYLRELEKLDSQRKEIRRELKDVTNLHRR